MTHIAARTRRAVLQLTTRVRASLRKAARRPDQGDISITTAIIWGSAILGAILISGSMAIVIAKYNGHVLGL
ncbi:MULTISPECIES: hypothetical protein [Streptomyces]|uniref:Uncharacterized protein n=1 Tax=Streptomyces noboritoensis TaxID=67337 RepID=A0ABV6TCN7_9ACTN|nr:hypothetical protein [Streptomyces melanogenes]GGP78202.1 hypothetical protein GCM10010278_65750 [Streptomyces melanogenes]